MTSKVAGGEAIFKEKCVFSLFCAKKVQNVHKKQ